MEHPTKLHANATGPGHNGGALGRPSGRPGWADDVLRRLFARRPADGADHGPAFVPAPARVSHAPRGDALVGLASAPAGKAVERTPAQQGRLALMLARQGLARWDYDATRFQDAADLTLRTGARDPLVLSEARFALTQVKALCDRMRGIAAAHVASIRLEAEQTTVSLRLIEARIERAIGVLEGRRPEAA